MNNTDKPMVKFYNDGSIAWSDFPKITVYECLGWTWWHGTISKAEYKKWCEL